MKLYHHPLSGCSRRVLAFAGVHGIDLDEVVVSLETGEHKKPGYLALNPTGRVPALQDGELTLFESATLLRYLAAKHFPGALGHTEEERALVDQWTTWGVQHLGAAVAKLNAETGLLRMRGGTPDPDRVEAAVEAVQAELAVLEGALGDRGFVVGHRSTIADFAMAPTLEASVWLSGRDVARGAVGAWLNRMTGLAGWPEDPPAV